MNKLSECTQWDWSLHRDPNTADCELMDLAYDHALLLAAITRHVYEPISEPIGDRIERYVHVWANLDEEQYDVFAEPELTPFGTPALTPSLRAALQRALGLEPTP